MVNLPKPKLGDVAAITLSSPDLEKSLAFYQKLGFRLLYRAEMPFPWIQITDGALLIMLRLDSTPYIALTYYVTDIDGMVAELEAAGIVFQTKPNPSDMIKRCLMKSPEGWNVSLVSFVEGFAQPTGPTMLGMDPQDYAKPEKYANQVCGMFGELAYPVKDLDASMAFWSKLGFNSISKTTAPSPWAILTDGLSIVGLHQTTQFDYPAITFFASDMKEKIAALKKDGLNEFTEQSPGNAVLTTPEQQKINLFNLGF